MRHALAQQAEEVETSLTNFDNYSLLPQQQMRTVDLEKGGEVLSPLEEQQIMLPHPGEWNETATHLNDGL
eukprot:CAMPEP_0170513316 /NCGR_PEP_ID=MMETSP0208-20121228/67338_1 /TAXON_ID=197538 /ORGANISM="Strombidium inclinatum, Strain S3" /LENGTH=69 /DNA_ID=CAMNT_0010797041 /DNA_START=189 /DNA_END=398 /DNA_ORIENTATION=+